jgi:hypothetical protein
LNIHGGKSTSNPPPDHKQWLNRPKERKKNRSSHRKKTVLIINMLDSIVFRANSNISLGLQVPPSIDQALAKLLLLVGELDNQHAICHFSFFLQVWRERHVVPNVLGGDETWMQAA